MDVLLVEVNGRAEVVEVLLAVVTTDMILYMFSLLFFT